MARPAVLIPVLALSALVSAATAAEPTLRYQPAANVPFAYEVEIVAESPSKITTLQGVIRYTATTMGEQIALTYRGGLQESVKAKATEGSGARPFGAPFGPGFRPGPPDFFSRPIFSGKMQTTNRITMTPQGNIVAMEGDSQLPYLLGNLSLMPFEPLPNGAEKTWSYDSSIAIETKNEQNRFGPGRFGPFQNSEERKTQSGSEAATFTIQNQTPQLVAVKKTSKLHTPAVGDEPAIDLTGEGTWTYSVSERVPEALAYKLKLVVKDAQTQTTIPISISFKRLTPDALAKIDLENQRRIEEMKQKAEAEKQKREAPLSAEEKRTTLADLQSGDIPKTVAALRFLSGKSVKEPDSEIVAAIEPLLRHANPQVKDQAKGALRRWNSEYDAKIKHNEAYSSHMPVPSTDRPVESTTPLFVGQILQFQEHGLSWYAGEVLELMEDGKVKVRKRGFAPREVVVTRRNLQLAPDEVEQPQAPQSPRGSSVATLDPNAIRTWVDASGQHKIQAAFLGVKDGSVQLRRADGKEIAVPLDKLSQPDQEVAQQLASQAKKVPNPFE